MLPQDVHQESRHLERASLPALGRPRQQHALHFPHRLHDVDCVKLLRHFANAVYLVDDHLQVVARVAYNAGVAQRSQTAVAVTRWLCSLGYPATSPVELPSGQPQPIVPPDAPTETAVSFWTYYPQPRDSLPPDIAEVASLARALHAIPELPPVPLPTYEPLRTMRRDIANSSLDPDSLAWLTDRVDQLLDEYAQPDFPLGVGLIHGDMYAGNLLVDSAEARYVLGDWDSVCIGPREIDLAPTFAAARFGLGGPTLARFAAAYGYDLCDWAGYPTLRSIRELSTLTALMRLAPVKPASERELRHRIDTLRGLDHEAIWQAQEPGQAEHQGTARSLHLSLVAAFSLRSASPHDVSPRVPLLASSGPQLGVCRWGARRHEPLRPNSGAPPDSSALRLGQERSGARFPRSSRPYGTASGCS